MIAEFKKFIMRGNVLDLAVAVIIGAAFVAVVQSFTDDILMSIVAAIFGEPDFSQVTIKLADGVIKVGSFINTVLAFLIVAAALFVVVKSFEALQKRRKSGELDPDDVPAPTDEALLLAEIRDLLKTRTP